MEVIMDPFTQTGPPSAYTVYIKNITDDLPEKSWTFPGTNQQNVSNFINPIHRYRAGTCAGSYDTQYLVMATFPSGSNQRIGGAAELEPTGIRASSIPSPKNMGVRIAAPSAQGVDFEIQMPQQGDFVLRIFSTIGKEVWQHKGVAAKAGTLPLQWKNANANGLYFGIVKQGTWQASARFAVMGIH
jgi:hypothetical protein